MKTILIIYSHAPNQHVAAEMENHWKWKNSADEINSKHHNVLQSLRYGKTMLMQGFWSFGANTEPWTICATKLKGQRHWD